MERNNSDAHVYVEPEQSSVMPVSRPAPLNIRWDRTAFAVVGLFALLVAGISGALNIFNMGSAPMFWAGLGVFVAVLVGLRAVAIRDANRRRAAAVAARERATTNAAVAAPPAAAVVQRETVLFDRVVGAEPAPVQKPLTAEELRRAALRVAAKGTADAKLAHTQTLAEGEFAGEPWEPIEVPKPGYVTAARAAAMAAPLVVPAAPKSAGTSIKADQAGIGVPAEGDAPVAVPAPDVEAPAAVGAAGAAAAGSDGAAGKPGKQAKSGHPLHNLDDVLQRRRA